MKILRNIIVMLTIMVGITAARAQYGVIEADAVSQLRILQTPGSQQKHAVADFFGKVWVSGDTEWLYYFSVTLTVNGEVRRHVSQQLPYAQPPVPNFLVHWVETVESGDVVEFSGSGNSIYGYTFYYYLVVP